MNDAKRLLQAVGHPRRLPQQGSWPTASHCLGKREALALIAALASERPILVRGEPGIGKSQLARAAADILERRFLSTVIQPNSEYEELLWTLDYTERLADAQMLAHAADRSAGLKPVQAYISPGPVWYALSWPENEAARNQSNYRPSQAAPTSSGKLPDPREDGVVLLIDEVDKADITLANGLLEVLGNGQFEVRHSGEVVRAGEVKPLVVLTSNDTRQLPAALLRRCVILDLALPADRDELIAHLVNIGAAHFPDVDEDDLKGAAQQIVDDREDCRDLPKTGQAEYLDLLRALDQVTRQRGNDWTHWLQQLAPFFHKSRVHR